MNLSDINYDFHVMIPFTKPRRAPNELLYIDDALSKSSSSGGGEYTKFCSKFLKEMLHAEDVLLTNSATDALEMVALLLNIQPGDEVIMPSYAFSSCANAFALRGAKVIFVDIDVDTLNIEPSDIESAISERTKAVLVLHYAGVSCDMPRITTICKRYSLYLIEDAAQGIMSKYEDQFLGTFGDLACLSFHSTKNVVSGEGGALIINNPNFQERARILLEKGTNRDKFLNGEIDKYSWVDLGSSFLPSEISAAYLKSQLEAATDITEYRLKNWNYYQQEFLPFLEELSFTLTKLPKFAVHNAHMFYLITSTPEKRARFISEMNRSQITCVTHYIPLHDSIAGKKFGGNDRKLKNTVYLSERIVRLPMWSHEQMPIEKIAAKAIVALKEIERS
jgi:dTDP-4-amino-4,6-dideoxygalactose transaminase